MPDSPPQKCQPSHPTPPPPPPIPQQTNVPDIPRPRIPTAYGTLDEPATTAGDLQARILKNKQEWAKRQGLSMKPTARWGYLKWGYIIVGSSVIIAWGLNAAAASAKVGKD
ncbi:hypothetical protein HDV00_000287 [Rhizophlyctis rosea]|nr:hypothetical protein HDV00_000287 [Rhizophlyctis rosea]